MAVTEDQKNVAIANKKAQADAAADEAIKRVLDIELQRTAKRVYKP